MTTAEIIAAHVPQIHADTAISGDEIPIKFADGSFAVVNLCDGWDLVEQVERIGRAVDRAGEIPSWMFD